MILSVGSGLKLSLFSTRRICSRKQRKKQHDWLATNTDDIATIEIINNTREGIEGEIGERANGGQI